MLIAPSQKPLHDTCVTDSVCDVNVPGAGISIVLDAVHPFWSVTVTVFAPTKHSLLVAVV